MTWEALLVPAPDPATPRNQVLLLYQRLSTHWIVAPRAFYSFNHPFPPMVCGTGPPRFAVRSFLPWHHRPSEAASPTHVTEVRLLQVRGEGPPPPSCAGRIFPLTGLLRVILGCLRCPLVRRSTRRPPGDTSGFSVLQPFVYKPEGAPIATFSHGRRFCPKGKLPVPHPPPFRRLRASPLVWFLLYKLHPAPFLGGAFEGRDHVWFLYCSCDLIPFPQTLFHGFCVIHSAKNLTQQTAGNCCSFFFNPVASGIPPLFFPFGPGTVAPNLSLVEVLNLQDPVERKDSVPIPGIIYSMVLMGLFFFFPRPPWYLFFLNDHCPVVDNFFFPQRNFPQYDTKNGAPMV